jgi:aminopeptidase N
LNELTYTTSFIAKAFNFYEEFLGFPYPLKTYKQIFVEETSEDIYPGATQSIFRFTT